MNTGGPRRPEPGAGRTRGCPPQTLILLYHRIAALDNDPFRISVPPWRFAEHLEVLKHYEPIPLPKLVDVFRSGGSLPERGICVTFDDGYLDALTEAAPALERAGIPGTVFVCTGALRSGSGEFWWDQLERLLLNLDSGEASDPSPGAERGKGDGPEEAEVFWATFRALQCMTAPKREHALRRLWRGRQGHGSTRPSHRPLRESELRQLFEAEYISVGSHTVSHPRLSKLWPRARATEIREAHATLNRFERKVRPLFAYPFGDSRRSWRLVRRLGMRGAVTTRPGTVRVGVPHYLLPRVRVGNWAPERLERECEMHFAGGFKS